MDTGETSRQQVNSLLRYHMECDEEVERKLLEAVDSPDRYEPVTEEFWESLRQRVRSVAKLRDGKVASPQGKKGRGPVHEGDVGVQGQCIVWYNP